MASRLILGTPSIYELTFNKSMALPLPSIILHRFYDTVYILSFRVVNFRGEWKLLIAISSKNVRQTTEKSFIDHISVQFPLTEIDKLFKLNVATISFLKASAKLFNKDPFIIKLTLREAEKMASKLYETLSDRLSVTQSFVGGPMEITPQINLSSHAIESKTCKISDLPQIKGEPLLRFTSLMAFGISSVDGEPYVSLFIKWAGKRRFGTRHGLISLRDWNRLSALVKNAFSLLLLSFKLREISEEEVRAILRNIGEATEKLSAKIFEVCKYRFFKMKQTSITKFLE